MTKQRKNQSFGPPPPVTKLTTEQEFRLKAIEIAVNKPEATKEDIVTVFLALQKQNFVLINSLNNVLEAWAKHPLMNRDRTTTNEVPLMFGILLETNDSNFTSET
tara:strand:+ start:73 stop:387 length:315 start_codon:yes stop_codon:yes gene_type:complete